MGETEKASPLTKATKPTRANVCCTIIINSIMLTFFAIYSFHNPDDDGCYIYQEPNSSVKYAWPVELNEEGRNMGLRFKIVFICGFVLCFINLAYAIVALIFFMYEAKAMLNLASCLVGLSGVLTIGWMIYASIVIFGDDADLCKD